MVDDFLAHVAQLRIVSASISLHRNQLARDYLKQWFAPPRAEGYGSVYSVFTAFRDFESEVGVFINMAERWVPSQFCSTVWRVVFETTFINREQVAGCVSRMTLEQRHNVRYLIEICKTALLIVLTFEFEDMNTNRACWESATQFQQEDYGDHLAAVLYTYIYFDREAHAVLSV